MPKDQTTGLGSASSGSSGGNGAATNSIAIDLSGMGGLDPNFWGDSDMTVPIPQRRILQSDMGSGGNALAQGYFNPWMREGYISPAVASLTTGSFSGTAPTNVLSSTVYDSLNDALYFAENGLNIYRALQTGPIPVSLDNPVLTNQHSLSVTGTTSIKMTDLEIYILNGIRTLFYSWTGIVSGVGAGGIGAYGLTPLGTPTWTDSWFYGGGGSRGTYNGTQLVFHSVSPYALASANPFMRLHDDGYMYIFDGFRIDRLDGTVLGGVAGTVYTGVESAPSWAIITDAVSYHQLLYVAYQDNSLLASTIASSGVTYTAPCKVMSLNTTTGGTGATAAVAVTDVITVTGIKSIQKLYISPNGKLRMLCIASNNLVQIREYDGSEFVVLKQMGTGAAPSYCDSLIVTDTHTIWLGNDGSIYGHGMVFGQSPEVLAQIGYIVAPSASPETNLGVPGAIAYGAGNSFNTTNGYRQDRQGLSIAYVTNSTSSWSKFYPFDKGTINNVPQTALAGNIFTGVHFLQSSAASFYTGTRFLSQLSTVGFINIFMAGGADAGDTTIQATIRIYFNGSTTQWGSGKTITRADIARGYKRIEINQPYINTIQLKIEYATGITLTDATDFHPYVALVYYTPSNTRG